jgi:hypothetical protein
MVAGEQGLKSAAPVGVHLHPDQFSEFLLGDRETSRPIIVP